MDITVLISSQTASKIIFKILITLRTLSSQKVSLYFYITIYVLRYCFAGINEDDWIKRMRQKPRERDTLNDVTKEVRKEDQSGWQHHYRFRRTLHRNPITDGEEPPKVVTRGFQKQRDSAYDPIRHEPAEHSQSLKLQSLSQTAIASPSLVVESAEWKCQRLRVNLACHF